MQINEMNWTMGSDPVTWYPNSRSQGPQAFRHNKGNGPSYRVLPYCSANKSISDLLSELLRSVRFVNYSEIYKDG